MRDCVVAVLSLDPVVLAANEEALLRPLGGGAARLTQQKKKTSKMLGRLLEMAGWTFFLVACDEAVAHHRVRTVFVYHGIRLKSLGCECDPLTHPPCILG